MKNRSVPSICPPISIRYSFFSTITLLYVMNPCFLLQNELQALRVRLFIVYSISPEFLNTHNLGGEKQIGALLKAATKPM